MIAPVGNVNVKCYNIKMNISISIEGFFRLICYQTGEIASQKLLYHMILNFVPAVITILLLAITAQVTKLTCESRLTRRSRDSLLNDTS